LRYAGVARHSARNAARLHSGPAGSVRPSRGRGGQFSSIG
jgi:hypothetical protein